MLEGSRGFFYQMLKQLWQLALLLGKPRNIAPAFKFVDAPVQLGELAKRYLGAVIHILVVELSHACTHIRRLSIVVAYFYPGYCQIRFIEGDITLPHLHSLPMPLQN